MREFTIGKNDAGQRLDRFISKNLPLLPPALLQKYIRLKRIKVNGKGGHGAHPENFVDPIAIAAFMLTQLQTVIARENHPSYPGVLTIGSIHGGKAYNIVPDYVEMGGTLRSLNPVYRQNMKEAIERISKCCAEAMRGNA